MSSSPAPLPRLYTFGSMSLGKDPVFPEADLTLVRRAMETGIWFHSSRTYNNGFTFMILRMAFDADRARTPKMILKIRDGSVPILRFETEDTCRRLGLDTIDIAQLVSMRREPGNLVEQLRAGDGPLLEELQSLRDRGLIQRCALYLDKGNAEAAVEAARHRLIDAVTFYVSPWQFDCTPTAWKALQALGKPLLALRTLGGGGSGDTAPERQRVSERFPDKSPLQLALDFAAGLPCLQTTIGGTASPAHFDAYIQASQKAAPLSADDLAFFEPSA